MTRLSISSVDVSQETYDWFIALANVEAKSRRELIGQMIGGHLIRWRKRHIGKIQYFANRHGLSWEQAFRLLSDPERKIPYKEDDIEWAKGLPASELWMTMEIADGGATPKPSTDTYTATPSPKKE